MGMTLSALDAPGDLRASEVLRLRREISRMQRRRSELPVVPVASALSPLFPEAGLQLGNTYTLSPSPSLVLALMSAASQKGLWCAVIGMPTLGIEAAAGYGIALERLILVPDPGERWLTVTSALSEVVPVIAVHPSTRIREAEASRLNARLRDRGCTLLVTGSWPQSEGHIEAESPQWSGLGEGWGLLSDRSVTIRARSRRDPSLRRVRVLLPGRHGEVESVVSESAPVEFSRWAAAG